VGVFVFQTVGGGGGPGGGGGVLPLDPTALS
jgi:hypothetical protein